MCDLLEAAMEIPLVTIQKDMDLADLVEARQAAAPRPSWCSIFTKAYGKVVASRPELRRAYLTFPWARIFEYRCAAADVTVEARIGDENVLVFVPIRQPENWRLLEMDEYIAECKADPIARIAPYRRALILAAWPKFIRRIGMWLALNASAWLRFYYFGNFGVTSVGNWGIESIRPIAPTISIIHYGAISPDGIVSVRLTYDHRVMDGSGPSAALVELENVLRTDIVDELRSLEPVSIGLSSAS
jgi:hypothetical protein